MTRFITRLRYVTGSLMRLLSLLCVVGFVLYTAFRLHGAVQYAGAVASQNTFMAAQTNVNFVATSPTRAGWRRFARAWGWYPAWLGAAAALWLLRGSVPKLIFPALPAGVCPDCGYHAGDAVQCPECGVRVSDATA